MDQQPGSPEWYRDKLLEELRKQRTRVKVLRDYYEGAQALPRPPKALQFDAYREACKTYESFSAMGVTNFCQLIANAPANRLSVVGFRFGESEGDEDAWRIWQRNHLDADQWLVYSTALSTSTAYALVWPDEAGEPVITPEDPSQTIIAYRPGSRRVREAALRSWDDDTSTFVVLYLPGGIYKWTGPIGSSAMAEWRPSTDRSWPVPNPLGVVPVVEFPANRRLTGAMYGGGRSEFEAVIPIQDRINKTVFDRIVAGEFQAFRQRYVVGWEPPTDPDGNVDTMTAYRSSASRLMSFVGEDGDSSKVKVGEFGQVDLGPFLEAVKADVEQMAAITQTPANYLLGQITNISSDALVASESPLIMKTKRHRDAFSESWEEVMRLALAILGDPRAKDEQSMVLWEDIEQRTWGQTVDAVLKMADLGIPLEALWAKLPNATPQDVQRWKSMATEQVLLAALRDQSTDVTPAPGNNDVPPADADDES